MIWSIKCRDCLFKTNDIMEVHKHSSETGHQDFALLDVDEVKVDWLHIEMELVREDPYLYSEKDIKRPYK